MMLHYFLGDDTIEIRDIIRPNAGRDAIPVFVRRCKLPRQGHRLHQPGVETDRTVLNVCSSRHLLDSLKTGAFHEVRYHTEVHIRNSYDKYVMHEFLRPSLRWSNLVNSKLVRIKF